LGSIAVVFGYWDTIKYSVNVLMGVIEKFFSDEAVDPYLASPKELLSVLVNALRRYDGQVIYAQSILTTELRRYEELFRKATQLVKRFKGISIAGGPHPSGDPYGTLLSLGFDYAVLGDAEEIFKKFLRNYLDNPGDFSLPEGFTSVEEGKVRFRGKGFVRDLDKYLPFSPLYRLYNPIEISRGCPFACRYCQVSYIFGALQRHRGVDEIVRWSNHLLRRGIRDIRFVTPNALGYGSKTRDSRLSSVEELLEALQPLRRKGAKIYLGTFPSEVRPEHVSGEVAKMLRRYVDNRRVVVGAQTGSSRLLRAIHRGHSPEDVLNAVEALRRYGFGVDVDYIFGLPGEGEEDIDETIRHMREVIRLGGRIHAHVFMPLPGTPYANSPPGKIPKKVLKFLNHFLGKGYVFGQWIRQERIANEIAELRERGVILSTAPSNHAVL